MSIYIRNKLANTKSIFKKSLRHDDIIYAGSKKNISSILNILTMCLSMKQYERIR